MTTLISAQLSALFEVSQPALPFRCLFHSQESFPKDFLEAAGVANVTISQYTRGHSPPDQLHSGTSKSEKPLPDPCKL